MNQNSWDFPWNMRAVDELTTFSCLKYFKTQIHSTQRIHQSFHIKKKQLPETPKKYKFHILRR